VSSDAVKVLAVVSSNSTWYFQVQPLSNSPVPVKANSLVIPIPLPLLSCAVVESLPLITYVAFAVPVTSNTPAFAEENATTEANITNV